MRAGMSALIVEDNAQMQFLLSEILRELRVSRISAAATVGEAKERCQYGGFAFALVDVGLGEENGLDFVRHVRSNSAHPAHRMPVIVVSGQGSRASIESARDAGADWFMVKPIRTADLVARLNRMFADPHPVAARRLPIDAERDSAGDTHEID